MEKARGCKETGDRWKKRRKECYHTGTITLHHSQAVWPECHGGEAAGGGNERDDGVKWSSRWGICR